MKIRKIISIIVIMLLLSTIFSIVHVKSINTIKSDSDPEIEIIDPLEGETIYGREMTVTTVKAEVSLGYPDHFPVDHVEFYVDGDLITDDAERDVGYYKAHIFWENFDYGEHTIVSVVIDENGSSGSDSITVTNKLWNKPQLWFNRKKAPDADFTGYQHVRYDFATIIQDLPKVDYNVKFGWDFDNDLVVDFWDDNGGSYFCYKEGCDYSKTFTKDSDIKDHTIRVISKRKDFGENAVSEWSDPIHFSINKNDKPVLSNDYEVKKKDKKILISATDDQNDIDFYLNDDVLYLESLISLVPLDADSGEVVEIDYSNYADRNIKTLYLLARDTHGAFSDLSVISIPTCKSVLKDTSLIYRFLENHPIISQIFEKILQSF